MVVARKQTRDKKSSGKRVQGLDLELIGTRSPCGGRKRSFSLEKSNGILAFGLVRCVQKGVRKGQSEGGCGGARANKYAFANVF